MFAPRSRAAWPRRRARVLSRIRANPLSIEVRIHRDAYGALESQVVVGLDDVGRGRRRRRDVAAARLIRIIRPARRRDAALELLEARTETVAHGEPSSRLRVDGVSDRSESPCATALAKHALRG